MKALISFTTVAALAAVLGFFPDLATPQVPCKGKTSIDYVGMWGPYYNACASELKTTFDYNIENNGEYRVIWCAVDNTDFSREYWAGEICPNPNPVCSGSIVEYTHCTTTTNHRLKMDVQTCEPYEIGFVYPYKLTAYYYVDTPY